MGSYLATFRTAKGELKSITVNASDPISARRYLRRRGIKALEFKNAQQSVQRADINREKEFVASPPPWQHPDSLQNSNAARLF